MLRYCSIPDCTERQHATYCKEHKPKRFSYNKTNPFYSSKLWKRLRKQVLIRDVMCCDCGLNFSEEADHIIPLSSGLELKFLNLPENLQGLCKQCHCKKSLHIDRSV